MPATILRIMRLKLTPSMNQPLSNLRLITLLVILVAEIALVISLRTSGWIATGHAIRSLMIAVAVVLPFIMTAVLLYRVRISLRHGQFSLRALMALVFVVGSFLALLPLFERPAQPNRGPSPLSASVTFEVFEVAATGAPGGLSFVDPETGSSLPVNSPPIITAADVLTVQLIPRQNDEYPYPVLAVVLNPRGGSKFLQATTRLKGGRTVMVADGNVLASPQVVTPIGGQFQVTGGRIHREGEIVFALLTGK
jgi:hypothetical protein